MKKTILLTLSLALGLNIGAQEYKKSWDFRKWSAETVANLKAGDDWSDIEKAASTEPTELSKEKCFWEVSAAGSTSEEVTLTANGSVIKELEGLWYTNTTARSLAIAVDYQNASTTDAAFMNYNGPSYLWLGSSKKSYFVIPHVAPGTTIKMGVESHKTSDARGIELYIGRGTSGTKLLDPDGNAVAIPTTYMDLEWLVPEDATDTPNEDGTYDIQIYQTNGCHIYYITVGEGDVPDVEEAKNVAYVTDPATSDDDFAYMLLTGSDKVNLNVVDAAEASSLEALQQYDAVIVSPYVPADAAIVPTLKSAIAYEPMLNLNVNLYEAWGYGKAVATDETAITIADAYRDNALFADLDIENGLEVLADGTLSGVELGSYFANDEVLGTVGDGITAIHMHNAGRNAYMLLPLTNENVVTEDFVTFIADAAVTVARTKKDIVATVTPTITKANKNLATDVTISCANKDAVIYYTTDGTEPTEASTVYNAPFTLTQAATVKAVAMADGYTISAVASLDVDIMAQAATPVINVANNADNTEVTISCATEGVDIYYSYSKITEASKAQKYTEPIVLSDEPTMIYAFATGADCVQSELGEAYVSINSLTAQTIRLDTLAHFDANQDDWLVDYADQGGSGSASAYYYFGKSAWNYYSTEPDHEEHVTGSDGQDSVIVYYKPAADAQRVVTPNTANGWVLKTAGQVLTGELTLTAEASVGNGATGRFAETAEDMIGGTPSKGVITFGAKISGEPYTASIETTEKYAAPFDVVTYVGNGNNGSASLFEIQISADGENWTSLGNINMASTQRYYKKTRVSCNESGEYYVRVAHVSAGTKGQVYDIYILNNGEESQKYQPTGIENVAAAAAQTVADEVYSINGVRQNGLQKGINIVRKHYADGSVKTVKVVVK